MNSIASYSGKPWCLRLAFDGVLEGHEHTFTRALVRIHVQEILAVVGHLARGDLVFGMACDRPCESALARPVRAHDGVDLTGLDVQVDSLENLLAFRANLKVFDIKHLSNRPL
jgi:hypothetical protein